MNLPRPPLITRHWFREGPVLPDGSDGYWICAYKGCGQHRGDHAQAVGQWMAPAHAFTRQRTNALRCRTCGYHRLHTRHIPWTWDQYPSD